MIGSSAASASTGAASASEMRLRPASQWRASSWLGPIHSARQQLELERPQLAGRDPRCRPPRTAAKNRRLNARSGLAVADYRARVAPEQQEPRQLAVVGDPAEVVVHARARSRRASMPRRQTSPGSPAGSRPVRRGKARRRSRPCRRSGGRSSRRSPPTDVGCRRSTLPATPCAVNSTSAASRIASRRDRRCAIAH